MVERTERPIRRHFYMEEGEPIILPVVQLGPRDFKYPKQENLDDEMFLTFMTSYQQFNTGLRCSTPQEEMVQRAWEKKDYSRHPGFAGLKLRAILTLHDSLTDDARILDTRWKVFKADAMKPGYRPPS